MKLTGNCHRVTNHENGRHVFEEGSPMDYTLRQGLAISAGSLAIVVVIAGTGVVTMEGEQRV